MPSEDINHCPYCGSEDIRYGNAVDTSTLSSEAIKEAQESFDSPIQIKENDIWQYLFCADCNSAWINIYSFSGRVRL